MKKIGDKHGQQEMVGFVLIVVIVVIALMIFLVISLRKPAQSYESSELENMLSSVMRYTTDCTIDGNPKNVEGLVKSCYKNQKCEEPDIMACEYLNQSLNEILEDLFESESKYQGYEFKILIMDSDEESVDILYEKQEGSCLGSSKSSSNQLSTPNSNVKINLMMKFCD